MAYYDTIIAATPLAYYRLGESVGPTAVDEISANNGTYNGTPTYSAQSLVLSDAANTSVNFGGGGDYVSLPNITTTGAFSIEFFMKATALAGYQGLVVGAATVGIWVNGTDLSWYQSGDKFSGTTLQNDTIYHVVLSVDATGNGRFYVDGVATPNSLTGIAANPFINIAYGVSAEYFNGVMDEVAIYDYQLTPETILAHYNKVNTFGITGVTLVQSVETACSLNLYLRSDGSFVSTTTSDGITGVYEFSGLADGVEYDVVCINPVVGICPDVQGPLLPTDLTVV